MSLGLEIITQKFFPLKFCSTTQHLPRAALRGAQIQELCGMPDTEIASG